MPDSLAEQIRAVDLMREHLLATPCDGCGHPYAQHIVGERCVHAHCECCAFVE